MSNPWLVKWVLMGEPAIIPLEMLLETPVEAFPYCRLADDMGTYNIDTTGFFAIKGKQTAILQWNRKDDKYRALVLDAAGTNDDVHRSPKLTNLQDAHAWIRQQLQ